jgi:hypothetical protein
VIRSGAAVLLAALLGGCSSLSPNDAGVSSLEVRPPVCGGIELGTTVDLVARTFDQAGDSVDAPVWWRTPDPSVIEVDSATGRTTGLLVSDTARVQAIVGTSDPLISDFVPLVVTPKADTLAQSGPARVTVDTNVSSSPGLLVTLTHQAPVATVKAFPLVYRVVEPVFATFEDRTVEFPGARLSLTVCSSASGTSSTTLNRRANTTQPDSAIVEVAAHHADGSTVPGSGWRFTVVFKQP